MEYLGIICFIVYFPGVLLVIGMGISQIKSEKPVNFYNGEDPIDEKELSDVSAWNKKHGQMWITYGIILIISFVIAAIIGFKSIWCVMPLVVGGIIPLIVMVLYHNELVKRYKL